MTPILTPITKPTPPVTPIITSANPKILIDKKETLGQYDRDHKYRLYYDIGANRTLAMFYAFRNYLGKFTYRNT